MSSIDHQMDEEMYKETTIIHKRHLTDAVTDAPNHDPPTAAPPVAAEE